jgi:hypothetical protein
MFGVSTNETKLRGEDFWRIVALQGAKMRQKAGTQKAPAEQVVKDIRRATRKHYDAKDKIRIVSPER